MKKKFSVTGMTCAACSAGIERTVKKLRGVESCTVSLMGECMDVTFDEGTMSAKDIIAAVEKLGYGAYEYGKLPSKKQKKIPLFVRFLISAVLLLPEMYFSMGHMISPSIVPEGWLNLGFQIGLTTAILAVNYEFFVSGVRAAVKLVPNMDTLVTLGASASYFYSLVVGISDPMSHLFFESAAMTTSPSFTSESGIFSSLPPRSTATASGASALSFSISRPVLFLLLSSSHLPRVTRVTIIAADSKKRWDMGSEIPTTRL